MNYGKANTGKVPVPNINPFKIVNQQNDVNNQILLAQAEDSFVREDTANSIEAGATICLWGSTDPELVGLTGYNKLKLSCYNNGKGMTHDELDSVCQFSSSVGKTQGKHGNKGKGGKLSSARINSAGLVWISCAEDPRTKTRKIHRVVMMGDEEQGIWGRQQFYVSNEDFDGYVEVVDITEIIDLESLNLDIDEDWTLKIYCGTYPTQNTVQDPYDKGSDSDGWLLRELSRRFPILPENFKINLGHKRLTNDGKKVFIPILQAIKDLDLDYETVTLGYDFEGNLVKKSSLGKTVPFYTEPNTVNVTYVYDPYCGVGNGANLTKSTTWYKTRMGITSTWSGVIYEGELYNYRGPQYKANTWRQCAQQLGILNGFDELRIFVSLPHSDNIVNDENRTKILQLTKSGPEEIELKDYRAEVIKGMPQWFMDIIQSKSPKSQSLDDIKQLLDERLKNRLVYQPASKDTSSNTPPSTGGRRGMPKTPSKPHTFECPECAKNSVKTIIPKGVRKCPVCGYLKPPVQEKGLYPDPNGLKRMIKRFPEIIVLDDDQWNGMSLDENFKFTAAQFLDQDNRLYINKTYESFKLMEQWLLENIDTSSEWYPSYKSRAEEHSVNFIVQECIGTNLINALAKQRVDTFDSDTVKNMLKPEALSVYADAWQYNEGAKKIKSRIDNDFKKQSVDIEDYDFQDIKDRMVEHGIKQPEEAA